jgi:hypothetical protein
MKFGFGAGENQFGFGSGENQFEIGSNRFALRSPV